MLLHYPVLFAIAYRVYLLQLLDRHGLSSVRGLMFVELTSTAGSSFHDLIPSNRFHVKPMPIIVRGSKLL